MLHLYERSKDVFNVNMLNSRGRRFSRYRELDPDHLFVLRVLGDVYHLYSHV